MALNSASLTLYSNGSTDLAGEFEYVVGGDDFSTDYESYTTDGQNLQFLEYFLTESEDLSSEFRNQATGEYYYINSNISETILKTFDSFLVFDRSDFTALSSDDDIYIDFSTGKLNANNIDDAQADYWAEYFDDTDVGTLSYDGDFAYFDDDDLGTLGVGLRVPYASAATVYNDIIDDGGFFLDTENATSIDSATHLETQGAFNAFYGYEVNQGANSLVTDYAFRDDSQTNDLFLGSSKNEGMWGGYGDDTLVSNDNSGGHTTITDYTVVVTDSSNANSTTISLASSGFDALFGQAGNDLLSGGNGDNVLSGGDGDDVIFEVVREGDENHLFGGAGRDTFIINANPESGTENSEESDFWEFAYNDLLVDASNLAFTVLKEYSPLSGFALDMLKTTLPAVKDILDEYVFGAETNDAEVEPDDGETSVTIYDFDPTEDYVIVYQDESDSIDFNNTATFSDGEAGLRIFDDSGAAILRLQGDFFSTDELTGEAVSTTENADYTATQLGNNAIYVEKDANGEYKVSQGSTELNAADLEALGMGSDYFATLGVDVYASKFVILGAFGPQDLYGSANSDEVYGTQDFADIIRGYGGDGEGATDDLNLDKLYGFGGDDWLSGGGGNDKIYGGDGIDTVFYDDSSQGVTLDLSDSGNNGYGTGIDGIALGTVDGVDVLGKDLLYDIENLSGSDHADTLIGNDDDNVLIGRGGDDTFVGHGGNDTFYGYSSDANEAEPSTVEAGYGSDTVDYNSSEVAIIVDLEAGTVTENTNNGDTDTLVDIENIVGTDYDDTFEGDSSDNSFDGGHGTDTIDYSSTDSAITLTIDGDAGTITATSDTIGTDTLTNIETFIGSSSDEDTVVVTGEVDLTGYAFDSFENFTFTVTGTEFTGTDLNDTITGDDTSNSISGGNGNDTIIGADGNDQLNGNGGDDTLTGGIGYDTLIGGLGTDAIAYNSSTSGIVADFVSGIVSDDGLGGVDFLTSEGSSAVTVEGVIGSDYGDRVELRGTTITDFTFTGNAGDDTLTMHSKVNTTYNGGEGTDTADYSEFGQSYTDADGDTITPGSGSETLTANLSTGEVLIGSTGAVAHTLTNVERLVGGTQGDVFSLSTLDSTLTTLANFDTSDVIEIDLSATGLSAGNISFQEVTGAVEVVDSASGSTLLTLEGLSASQLTQSESNNILKLFRYNEVSLAVTDATAVEPSNSATYTLTRSGFTDAALSVNITATAGNGLTNDEFSWAVTGGSISGNLTAGYSVTFDAGESVVELSLTPSDDGEEEDTETLTLQLASGDSYSVASSANAGEISIFGSSTLVVDTLVDEDDGDYSSGDLSLREAIATVATGGSILFSDDLATTDLGYGNGVIGLTEGELSISQNLSIDGESNITLDGLNSNRIAYINGVSDVTLAGLTVTNGSASTAGGISIGNSTVTIQDSIITGNTATASSGDGGGLRIFDSTVYVENSMVSNNYSNSQGGGIHLKGVNGTAQLYISDTLITGNTADISGDAGGGVYGKNASVVIANSTISGNSTANNGKGAGVSVEDGSLTVRNTTIYGNATGSGADAAGGGIFVSDSTFEITSSIVTGNTATAGSEIQQDGTVTSSNNLLGNSAQSTSEALSGFTASQSDITATSDGTDPTALDNILDTTLADNGGASLTHALVTGSIAIDAGSNPDGLASDQRGEGYDRTSGIATDIGAYETENTAPTFEADTYSFEISEDSIAETTLGTLSATDAESNTLTYSITNGNSDADDDEQDAYRLDGNTLVVNDADDLDYATNATIDLTVVVSDGALSDTATVTVNLTEVAGEDVSYGSETADITTLSGGDDTLYSLGGSDEIDALAGNDTVYGGDDNDTINGNGGDDALYGEAGDDILNGQAGNDTLSGGEGADTITGGAGDDTITGGADADTLDGDGGEDTIYGGAGDDSILGGAHDDTIDGGDGSDTINGGNGRDTITGGDGDDIIYGVNDKDTIYGEWGNDVILGGDGSDTLYGGDDNDTITGGNTKDYLYGDAGNDKLNGSGGFDTLTGGAGDDNLRGQAGDDILIGVNPDATAPGSGERDQLLGGLGADTFVLGDGINVYYQGSGSADYAWVRDFDATENDLIQLTGSADDYSLGSVGSNTYLYYTPDGQTEELIANIKNVSFTDFTSGFTFVDSVG